MIRPSIVTTKVVADRIAQAGDDRLRLEHYGFKVYSQSDEDGVIEEVFRRIGIKDRTFVEFGAETGVENNTRYLLAQGWSGLWIEAMPQYAEVIRKGHRDAIASGRLKFLDTPVTAENINDLISSAEIKGEIDFLSIDIDGNDYHVFEAIHVIQPRVVCLEHNPTFPPPADWVMPYNPHHRWTGTSTEYGASIVALERLARSKGYVLVGCSLYSPNGYYVRSDLVTSAGFSAPYRSERFFQSTTYDAIISFPRDVFKSELMETGRKLADSESRCSALAKSLRKANQKLAEEIQKRRNPLKRLLKKLYKPN